MFSLETNWNNENWILKNGFVLRWLIILTLWQSVAQGGLLGKNFDLFNKQKVKCSGQGVLTRFKCAQSLLKTYCFAAE